MRAPRAFVVLLVVSLAACKYPALGPPADAPPVVPADAAMHPDAVVLAVPACNVLTQTGCPAGDKCTWVVDLEAAYLSAGHVGCVPNGSVAVGGACTLGAAGATGYDNCVQGAYCYVGNLGPAGLSGSGTCKQICDPAGVDPLCDSMHACSTYENLFGNQGMGLAAGLCETKCDPVADNNFLGTAGNNRSGTACGSALLGSGASQQAGVYAFGCYGEPNGYATSVYSCTHQYNPSRIHRSACDTTIHPGDYLTCAAGEFGYVNGCAAGYEPLYYDAEGSTQIDCIAFCKPALCYNAGTGSTSSPSCGTNGVNITGNSTSGHDCKAQNVRANSFLQATATATPTLNSNGGAGNGEQCFYSWVFEINPNTGMLTPSPYSDSIGFCVDHTRYKYDPLGGSNATTVWPRCDLIGLGSSGYNTNSGIVDATGFGCVDTATARAAGDISFSGKASFRRLRDLRLPYHAQLLDRGP